jgi:hypothetical protein
VVRRLLHGVYCGKHMYYLTRGTTNHPAPPIRVVLVSEEESHADRSS